MTEVYPKTLEKYFADWESNAFGFGYGTGEYLILPELKKFFAAIQLDGPNERGYDYTKIETAVGPVVCWLLINLMCQQDVFEYGTSPRYGWLSKHGLALKTFVDSKTAEELYEICTDRDMDECYPSACNCGPNGYDKNRKCPNPFWPDKPDWKGER